MTEERRLAVIVTRHDLKPPVTIDEAKHLLLTGSTSIVRYWRENAENWFSFATLDFYGSYDITLPAPRTPGSDRWDTLGLATAAASGAGVNLAGYDGFIVLLHPGLTPVNTYDGGATGVGPGASCVLPTHGDHTFFCHETGHILGFDHSYGIVNSGADWDPNDEVVVMDPVYGDPYDLMSSASFGGSAPVFPLPPDPLITQFPNWRSAGPMLSRATLHYFRPGALEATNKIRHVFEGGPDQIFTLYPAGQGDIGKPELIVYHPAGEDGKGRGRVYVEYRQPFSFNFGSRWDEGLASNMPDRDNRGVVVHVVKESPDLSHVVVWYAGRLVFPSPDSDLTVDTPRGSATVTVSQEFVQEKSPGYVRVRINRGVFPGVTVLESATESEQVLETTERVEP